MSTWIIDKVRLGDLVAELLAGYEVIAPRDEISYGVVCGVSDIRFDTAKPRKSLKEHFFTPQQTLLQYHLGPDGTQMTASSPETAKPRVVLGARPCDAAALPILDRVFTWDYVDPFYVQQRQNTTIIALACDQACPAGFCTSVGGSPAGTEGVDVLLSPMEERYHVQVMGAKGEALVTRYAAFFAPSTTALDDEQATREAQWRSNLEPVNTAGLAESLDFESPIWQSIARQCVDCGVCTFTCPTCHCFDIQDEGTPTNGARVRLWDSCAFRSFTKTSVHEPRATHSSRYRQRIMHKFQYYPQNFQRTLCVGCGRCVQYCPVGIDLRQVLEAVRS
jgi:sulfhydrogenase subunit beta (sulfur reductase)